MLMYMQHKALYLMPLRVTLFIPFYSIYHSKKHVISQQSQQVWDPGSNAKDDFAINCFKVQFGSIL